MNELKYPAGHFTIDDVAVLNGTQKAKINYQIKRALENGTLFKVSSRKGKVGRPTVILSTQNNPVIPA